MRVVIASRIFAPEPAAASFRLAALAQELSSRGHSVRVLTTRPVERASKTSNSTEPRLHVSRWPVLRDRSGYVRGYIQYLSFDAPLFFRLLFSRRPDVVVLEPPPTTGAVVRAVCAIRRIPYIYFAADIWSDAARSTGAPRLVVRLVRTLEAGALRMARRVLAVNEGVAGRVRMLSGHDRVDVVGNGIDTRVFSQDGVRRGSGVIGVYAGTTSEWQGADIFLRAMPAVVAAIPDVRLVFVGQGSAWVGLRQLADSLGLRCVDFLDPVPPAEAAAWLRSATIGMVSLRPGTGYEFAFPTKVYAALATGTPVLYVGPGPAARVITDANLGRAVDYDVHEVAEAMIELFGQPEDPTERAKIARWAEENVSLAVTAAKAADSISRALSEPG
jgi:glycosyltransferase involved in cell wall biosynthesis